jgi:hypothetical protein
MKKFILSSNEKLPEILDCFGIDFFFTTWNIKEVHEDEQYNCWLLLNQLDNAFMYHKKFLLKKALMVFGAKIFKRDRDSRLF